MRTQDMLLDAARRAPKRIVLCEGGDPRVRPAARRAADDGIAQVFLVGSDEDVPGVRVIRPADSGWLDVFAEELLTLRRARGMTPEQALEAVRQPLVFAALMVRLGHADGTVAGAVHTTADVVRTALQIIGRRSGVRTVSSFFLMMRDEPFPTGGHAMVFSDCGLVIEPDSRELAEIALARWIAISPRTGEEIKIEFESKDAPTLGFKEQLARIRATGSK